MLGGGCIPGGEYCLIWHLVHFQPHSWQQCLLRCARLAHPCLQKLRSPSLSVACVAAYVFHKPLINVRDDDSFPPANSMPIGLDGMKVSEHLKQFLRGPSPLLLLAVQDLHILLQRCVQAGSRGFSMHRHAFLRSGMGRPVFTAGCLKR